MREKNYFFRFYTKFQFLSDLEVVLIGEVVILVVVTGGKKSQPSLPLDFNWIWIVLDRIWLEFDNTYLGVLGFDCLQISKWEDLPRNGY